MKDESGEHGVAVEESFAARDAEETIGEKIADELEGFDVDTVKSEVESVDIGDIAKDDDERTLFRYLRRRSQLAMEITHIKDQTKALIQSLENRVKGLDYVYTGIAQDICRKKLTGKVKSVKTPFGVVGFRTTAGKLEITDESKLLNEAMMAAEDSPLQAFFEMVPSLKKSAVNEYFKTTGELPPHCEMTDAVEKFYVK